MLSIGQLYQIRELSFEEELRQRVIFKRSWKKSVIWLDLNHDGFVYVDLEEAPWMVIEHLIDLTERDYYKILVGEHLGWIEWTDYLEQAPLKEPGL